MEKMKLSSFLGDAFLIVFYIMGFMILCVLIYSIAIFNLSDICASIFFLLFWMIIFGRKMIRFREVYFDKEYIYTNKFGKIQLHEIEEFSDKKIKFSHNGKRQIIYFNDYFLSKNYFVLKRYIEEAKG